MIKNKKTALIIDQQFSSQAILMII